MRILDRYTCIVCVQAYMVQHVDISLPFYTYTSLSSSPAVGNIFPTSDCDLNTFAPWNVSNRPLVPGGCVSASRRCF